MSNRLRIAIIGPGKVGRTLGMGWKNAGHTIVAVTPSRQEQVKDALEWQLPEAQIVAADQLPEADLVAVTTPDDAIGPVVEGLARLGRWRPGQIVLHASGAHGLEVLEPAARAGALTIALHPAMTFTGYSLDLQRLIACPVAVTATAVAMPIAQALVYELEAVPVPVENDARQLYHAALVHGSNHLYTLLTQARTLLKLAGVKDAGAFLRPLAQASLENALTQGPLTGPVARADVGTLRRHVTQLQGLEHTAVVDDSGEANFAARQAGDTYLCLAQGSAMLAFETGQLSSAQLDAVLLALRDTP